MSGVEAAVAAAVGGGMAAGVGQTINAMLSSDGTHRSWYQFQWLYNIFQFPDEYTDLIDMMLAKDTKAIVRDWIMKSTSLRVPAVGYHLYYWSGCGDSLYWHYVTFEKKLSPQNTYYYVCHCSKRQIETFGEAVTKIFKTESGKIRTISIDTSRPSGPFPLFVDKICSGNPLPHQKTAIDYIIQSFSANSNRNCKVCISAVRGSGKSYLGRLVKQQLEANPQFKDSLFRLYDDFNPSAPGCSIKYLVLQNAKTYTPVILIIDEVDICFGLASDGNRADKHATTVHTKDKKTFNDMMDSIGDTQNIIAIFTTEKSPADLYANVNWHSFMRTGRIDYFLQYVPVAHTKPTQFTCAKVQHSQITGYVG